MIKRFGRKGPIYDAQRANTLALSSRPAGTVAAGDILTLTDPQYIVLTAHSLLDNERVLAVDSHLDLTDGGAGSNATIGVDLSAGFAWTGAHSFNQDIQLDADLDFVGAQSITTTTDNLTLAPAGDLILDPTGNDILPNINYDLNLGSISNKFLTLHAAELWVNTLVAQETMATIGGRILVGPTTTLIADLAPAGSTFDVKHNSLASGDRVVMEASGKLEFIAVTSGSTPITGGYRYSITRNLDGTGANQWYAGDAVFNTGTTGDGFIDIYSLAGVVAGSTAGPTIVGNVRNSGTYNDYSPRWAIGNLNGLFGYSSSVYGAAFGDYSGGNYMVADAGGLALYAGNGVLSIDSLGVEIEATTSYTNARAYNFKYAGNDVGGLYGMVLSGTNYIKLEAAQVTGLGANINLIANAPASKAAGIGLSATQLGSYQASVVCTSPVSNVPYVTIQADYTTITGLAGKGDLRILGGVYVGATGTDPDEDDVWIDGDGRIGGGLYIGGVGTAPTAGSLTTTGDIICKSGIWAGANAAAVGDGYVVAESGFVIYKNSTYEYGTIFIPLTTPYTSATFNGSGKSDTTTTLTRSHWSTAIPAGAKAILMEITCRDSATAPAADLYVAVGPAAGTYYQLAARPIGDDIWTSAVGPVPCGSSNGDCYLGIDASGTGTMDVYLRVWGYWM